MIKTLNNLDVKGAKKQVPDLELFGNGDLFKLLTKASSKSGGWMKSTKVMEIVGLGCVIQVTAQQDGNIAEAACFVPGSQLCEKEDGYRCIVKANADAPKQKIACPECHGEGTVQKNVEELGWAKDLQDVSCDLCWGSGKLLIEPFLPLSP